jgi:hypothetical protein
MKAAPLLLRATPAQPARAELPPPLGPGVQPRALPLSTPRPRPPSHARAPAAGTRPGRGRPAAPPRRRRTWPWGSGGPRAAAPAPAERPRGRTPSSRSDGAVRRSCTSTKQAPARAHHPVAGIVGPQHAGRAGLGQGCSAGRGRRPGQLLEFGNAGGSGSAAGCSAVRGLPSTSMPEQKPRSGGHSHAGGSGPLHRATPPELPLSPAAQRPLAAHCPWLSVQATTVCVLCLIRQGWGMKESMATQGQHFAASATTTQPAVAQTDADARSHAGLERWGGAPRLNALRAVRELPRRRVRPWRALP